MLCLCTTLPRRRFYNKFPLFCGLLFVCISTACASIPYTDRNQLILVSQSKEIQMGLEASDEILRTEKVETGSTRAKLVKEIGNRLASAADRPDFVWEFHTIDKQELNAFCLPGGKVFVYTGLIELLGHNKNELAAVMGHEVAHAIARHGAERVSQNMLSLAGTVTVGAAVGVHTGSIEKGIIGGAATGALMQLGLLLPYSRLHETEADRIGVILAAKAGYDPRAAISLWQKMAAASGGKEPPALLSTHPVNSTRISNLQNFMPEALKYYKNTN